MTVEEFIKKWKEENPLENETKRKVQDGALCGVFAVSNTRKVRFSMGNLQFNDGIGVHDTADKMPLQGTWRFAENQWEVVNSSKTKSKGWIDLFGWGTSGWNSGAISYQPWSISQNSSDYYPGKNSTNDLTGACKNADWGVYNAISNGGNKPGLWRTLTSNEWKYLFTNNAWTMGKVAGMLCFLLLPERFVVPSGVKVVQINNSTFVSKEYKANDYTAEEFKRLEDTGVVALPCGGCRFGTTMINVGSYGYYWSSSANGSIDAYGFYFSATGVDSDDYGHYDRGRSYGRSVRLVQDL